MAPELFFASNETLDLARADLYSLGVTMYELVSGRTLRESTDSFNSTRKRFERVAERRRLPHRLRAIILSLLDIDPSSRTPADQLASSRYLAEAELEVMTLLHEAERGVVGVRGAVGGPTEAPQVA